MNTFLEALTKEDNYSETENGAVALDSTLNACLDAFGGMGSMRETPDDEIIQLFRAAFYENQPLAMRLLFYMRDIRGGQGVRHPFRACMKWLAIAHPECVTANFDNFLFFGRGDDFYCLVGTPVEDDMFEYIHTIYLEDMATIGTDKPCTLLAKWLKSPNTSSKESSQLGKLTAKKFHMTEASYRKGLAALRKKIGVIENYMSHNEWDKIKFEGVPSRAAMIYRDAFYRHQEDRYTQYIKDVASGNTKINAGTLYPVDIIHNVLQQDTSLANLMVNDCLWNALPNYFEGLDESGICVVDTSGSMYGTPIEVALSLGIYCAEKCTGPFKDHFITFSRRPKLQRIVGKTIYDKVNSCKDADWDMNTNLEKVFLLILDTAIKYNTTDIPKKLYIISDMQFDQATSTVKHHSTVKATLMDDMRALYAENNLEFPSIVYWNVSSRTTGMFQQDFQGENCCMVSGYSPSLFKAVIQGTEYVTTESGEVKQKLDPMTIMKNTLMNERYDRVASGL